MLNIIQYALLAIIPVVLLNKLMSKYVPEADDKKSSLEVSAEIIVQVIVIFMGLHFINKIITFFPTYSGAKYPEFSVIYIILSVLMIVMSLQTKLGDKVNILVDRIVELWEGESSAKKNKNKKAAQQQVSQVPSQEGMTMNNALYNDGTAINSLPMNPPQMQPRNNTQTAPPSQEMESIMEPMAANSLLGGSSFGTW
jgi:hypothetical protein